MPLPRISRTTTDRNCSVLFSRRRLTPGRQPLVARSVQPGSYSTYRRINSNSMPTPYTSRVAAMLGSPPSARARHIHTKVHSASTVFKTSASSSAMSYSGPIWHWKPRKPYSAHARTHGHGQVSNEGYTAPAHLVNCVALHGLAVGAGSTQQQQQQLLRLTG
jgi:hypothetical protein